MSYIFRNTLGDVVL